MMTTKTINHIQTNIKKHDISVKIISKDTLIKDEFDMLMQNGLAQAKYDNSVSVDEAFIEFKTEITHETYL